ncbi:MAG: methionyl-tRNA formyltransferase, partial [Bacteroidota bacterium]
MKIIFMGTPEFAVPTLDLLIENNYKIAAVVTAPDRPAGRGRKLQFSDVKKYAFEKELKILQPEKLRSPEFLDEIRSINPDLAIVVAFRMLPEEVWKLPRIGTFNLHASLLPQYRGAAPINHAIINGEKETGLTTFFIDEQLDTGKIILQEVVKIEDQMTAGDLHDEMKQIGANLVLKTVRLIEKGHFNLVDQDEIAESFQLKPAPKIYKENCCINWQLNVKSIYDLIRGLSPHPGAWSEMHDISGDSMILKIFRCH